ncbi:MAG: hypothetical protein H6955_06375 [Chromatiaceae bacterium]|nr:hypothetical protein [Chromatiaceae bacterium]
MNDYEDYLIDALDMVAAWELPDEDLADAVLAQARLMAGLSEDFVAQRDNFLF